MAFTNSYALSAGKRKGKERKQHLLSCTTYQWERFILLARLRNSSLSNLFEHLIEEAYMARYVTEIENNNKGIPNDLVVAKMAQYAEPDEFDKEFFNPDYEVDYKTREKNGDTSHMSNIQRERYEKLVAAGIINTTVKKNQRKIKENADEKIEKALAKAIAKDLLETKKAEESGEENK